MAVRIKENENIWSYKLQIPMHSIYHLHNSFDKDSEKSIPGSITLASSSACPTWWRNSLSIWEQISPGPWLLTISRHSRISGLPCFLSVLLLNLEISWVGLPSIAEAACVWQICSACFQIARITSWIENASSCLPASIFLRKKRQCSHLKIYKLLVKKNLYQQK